MSNKISSGKKNYKYFIGYFYDDCKIKPLYLMLMKINKNIKSCNG